MQEVSEMVGTSVYPSSPSGLQSVDDSLTNSQSLNNNTNYLTIVFIILGFYFFIFGIVQLVTNASQKIYKISLNCGGSNTCISQKLFIGFDSMEKVDIYFSQIGICQHDIYSIYNTDSLLTQPLVKVFADCGEYSYNKNINKTTGVNGNTLPSNQRAIPCGRYPSMFPEGNLSISNGLNTIKISTDQLTDYSVDNVDLSKQWVDFTNQRFLSWMQKSSSFTINKFWGHTTETISGQYTISYEFNTPQSYETKYSINLQNNKALGGYNIELCILNFVFGAAMFIAGLCSFILNGKAKGLCKNMFNFDSKNQNEEQYPWAQQHTSSQLKVNIIATKKTNKSAAKDEVIETDNIEI